MFEINENEKKFLNTPTEKLLYNIYELLLEQRKPIVINSPENPGVNEPATTKSAEMFICPKCGKQYTENRFLASHMRSHKA